MIGKPYAAVMVSRKKGKDLVIVPGQIHLLKDDTQVVELPEDYTILNPEDGTPIEPSFSFWITTETFDPFHAVIDWDGR